MILSPAIMLRANSLVFFVAAACSATPISPRILGSNNADIVDFPYVASIELYDVGFFGGAVIISADWALTNAQRTSDPVDVELYTVRVGSVLLGNGTLHSVIQWVNHPLADFPNGQNQFALIQVDPPFKFGVNVQAVQLAEAEEATPDGAEAVIAGWGMIVPSPDWTTDNLRFAAIAVLGETACSAALGPDFQNSKLCAQDPEALVASCFRDTGGPLVVDGRLFGIALWPGVCGDPLDVQLYARVASARKWIDSTINA